MTEARKAASRIEAALKHADPQIIVERTFYDEISNRLYVNVVKGSRKTEIVLVGRERSNNDQQEIDRLVEQCLLRLKNMPIG